jgi:hypothetical protein
MSSTARLIGGAEDAIGTLCDGLFGGQLSPAAWHNQLLHTLGEYHTAAYLLGRDTTTISGPAQKFLLETMGKQADYLGRLTDAIEDGRLSDAETRARAQSYAGAVLRRRAPRDRRQGQDVGLAAAVLPRRWRHRLPHELPLLVAGTRPRYRRIERRLVLDALCWRSLRRLPRARRWEPV